MSLFRSNIKEPKCSGFYLPCFNCDAKRKCNIVDFFNNDKLEMSKPNIQCISCENMLYDVRFEANNYYKILYDKIFRKIDRRFKKMLYCFNDYVIYDEIYNLSTDKKNLICNLIKIILYNHINLYGDKTKIIDFNYLLLKIFNLLGIDMGISLNLSSNLSNIYDKYFENILLYSNNDISDIINEFTRIPYIEL